jgi:GTPase Era involved in 16S rRNA processing
MSDELDAIVADTIALTGAAAPDLLADDAPVLSQNPASDEMYLVGLIGGKDVGKSSLINALVAHEISEQSSHGRGTETVIAYAHESSVPALRELLDRHVPGRFRVHPHTIANLERQVLLDLPDIDSVYSDHIEITRKMLRHMLYPVWIQSVEKYADQQPQKLLARVAEGNDPGNFVFCLNKVDQIEKKEGSAAVVEIRDDYATRIGRLLDMNEPPSVYAISATTPARYDLSALRAALSNQRTKQDVRESRQLAGRQRTRTILAWLDAQRLPEKSQRIAHLREDAGETIAARLAVPILEDALPRLVNDPAYRLSIIDPVVAARMKHWPIVNMLHGLLSPFFALVRRNIGISGGADVNIDEYLANAKLATMVQTTFAQLQQSNPTLGTLYSDNKLWESIASESAAADLKRRLRDTLSRQREAATERIGRRAGFIAGVFGVILTIGAIVWFPIAQPVLEVMLQQNITGFSRELALKVVQLLSTTFILKNLAFLVLWFAVLWALVRGRTHRRVSRLIGRWQSDPKLDPALSFTGQTLEWTDGLLDPIQRHQDEIERLVARIEKIREQCQIRSAA